jgi:hypothetical protein
MNRLFSRWYRLGSGDRRAILLGAMILGPAVALKLVLLPLVRSWSDLRAEIATERSLLAREEELLSEADRWPVRYTADGARLLAAAPRLYDGADQVAGAGALASYLAQRATARRVFLQQTELRPTEKAGEGVSALGVELRGSTDLEGLLRFVQDIENGKPLVRVERVHIERAERPSFGAHDDEEVLSFSLAVRGFALSTDSTAVAR